MRYGLKARPTHILLLQREQLLATVRVFDGIALQCRAGKGVVAENRRADVEADIDMDGDSDKDSWDGMAADIGGILVLDDSDDEGHVSDDSGDEDEAQ